MEAHAQRGTARLDHWPSLVEYLLESPRQICRNDAHTSIHQRRSEETQCCILTTYLSNPTETETRENARGQSPGKTAARTPFGRPLRPRVQATPVLSVCR